MQGDTLMRVLVAGATGAIGRPLLSRLLTSGHHVIGTTRMPQKVPQLRADGAEPIVVDVLDAAAVLSAVMSAKPDVVVHQVTALSGMVNFRRFEAGLAPTNRLRTEGIDNLLRAARAGNATHFVAQSFTGWPNTRQGGRVKVETDPVDPTPPASMRSTLNAIRYLERAVLTRPNLTGTVLRYGAFYGPGTGLAADGDIVRLIRRRMFPIFGDGAGVWSFVHVNDAAEATAMAIEQGRPGLYNIVDDEPAEVSVWLPELARALGAKHPYRLPAWLGRLVMGEAGMSLMTRVRGSSNAKAKNELGWRPNYPSWREGFRRGLAS